MYQAVSLIISPLPNPPPQGEGECGTVEPAGENSMESDHIKCPQCGTEIEVGEVLARQVTVDVEARLRQEAEVRLKQAVAAAQAKERDTVRLQLQDMESQLSFCSS